MVYQLSLLQLNFFFHRLNEACKLAPMTNRFSRRLPIWFNIWCFLGHYWSSRMLTASRLACDTQSMSFFVSFIFFTASPPNHHASPPALPPDNLIPSEHSDMRADDVHVRNPRNVARIPIYDTPAHARSPSSQMSIPVCVTATAPQIRIHITHFLFSLPSFLYFPLLLLWGRHWKQYARIWDGLQKRPDFCPSRVYRTDDGLLVSPRHDVNLPPWEIPKHPCEVSQSIFRQSCSIFILTSLSQSWRCHHCSAWCSHRWFPCPWE